MGRVTFMEYKAHGPAGWRILGPVVQTVTFEPLKSICFLYYNAHNVLPGGYWVLYCMSEKDLSKTVVQDSLGLAVLRGEMERLPIKLQTILLGAKSHYFYLVRARARVCTQGLDDKLLSSLDG